MVGHTVTDPRYLKQAAYARLRGVAKSHVTKLKQTGRLVITPRGLVDVAASDALIAQTGGLRPDVAERLAEQRAPAVGAAAALPLGFLAVSAGGFASKLLLSEERWPCRSGMSTISAMRMP